MSVPLAELPDVLTPLEFANLARKGRNWSYEMIATGQVRAIRLGTRSWRIPKAEALRVLGLSEKGRPDAAISR